ncbi:MAG: cytoplasmic protein [Desulfamplus sp.]|nr:cytoplasmic protein [Desulfamplus sp.]MBF0259371.1 cytoplasmic protein [Desulfamplus sp.]
MSNSIKHDDFTVDKNNLYREESITDFKIATIKILHPIKIDGSIDESRTKRYFGETQMMSPDGPIPVRAMLAATTNEEAIDAFPVAMDKALAELVQRVKQMQSQHKDMGKSKIIPGR